MGLPIPGSPLVFPFSIPLPISPIPPIEYKLTHIHLERGGCGCLLFCATQALVAKPTSLMRGEGLIAGFLGMVGKMWRELRMDGGGGGMNQYQL